MVAAVIDDHVGARRHVTVDTASLLRDVSRVFDDVELGRQVALRAGVVGIVARDKLRGMWIVAVRAGNARRIHTALQERAIDIHFIEDLPVGEVQALIEQRRQVRVRQRRAVLVLRRNDAAARMASVMRMARSTPLQRAKTFMAPGCTCTLSAMSWP